MRESASSEGTWGSIRKWFKENQTQVLLFVGVLALYFLLGLFLWLLLDRYIDPGAFEDASKEATAKKELVQALGLIMAGVAGAIGIYFTWRGQLLTRQAQLENQENTQKQISHAQKQLELTQRAQEENQKATQEQLQNAQKELELIREGQLTERFTRAIDQLGATDDKTGKPRLEIRLGGIYALERIDKESPERAYHRTVIEVLTAYVRENSRRDHGKSSRPTSVSNEEAEQDRGAELDAEPSLQTPPTDIQAILDVLNRRQQGVIPRDRVHHLELHGSVLPRAQLQKADLRGATLQGGQLQGAGLENANLQGAKLQRANLQKAELQGANLQGAQLQKADFQGANLQGANLQGANLQGAKLQRARGLRPEHIELTIGDGKTELPEYLVDHRPSAWSKSFEEQRKITRESLRGD